MRGDEVLPARLAACLGSEAIGSIIVAWRSAHARWAAPESRRPAAGQGLHEQVQRAMVEVSVALGTQCSHQLRRERAEGNGHPGFTRGGNEDAQILWCRSTRNPGSYTRATIDGALRSRMRFPASPPDSTLIAALASTP